MQLTGTSLSSTAASQKAACSCPVMQLAAAGLRLSRSKLRRLMQAMQLSNATGCLSIQVQLQLSQMAYAGHV